jgi:hypothetical protein
LRILPTYFVDKPVGKKAFSHMLGGTKLVHTCGKELGNITSGKNFGSVF